MAKYIKDGRILSEQEFHAEHAETFKLISAIVCAAVAALVVYALAFQVIGAGPMAKGAAVVAGVIGLVAGWRLSKVVGMVVGLLMFAVVAVAIVGGIVVWIFS